MCDAAQLAALNAEAQRCIERWRVRVDSSAVLGRFLLCDEPVPAGSLVMVLPPNRILPFASVDDFNTVIQVRRSAVQAERLYSASLSPRDLDNFLSHACVPCCAPSVDDDLSVRLVATRRIAPGEPISIDYEVLEEDMLQQGVDFECACGADTCRGRIVGSGQRVQAVA